MKVCIDKSTGALLEAHSAAEDGAVIASLVRAGHDAENLEERTVTDDEYAVLATQNAVVPCALPTIAEQIIADPKELAKLKAALDLCLGSN